MSYLSKVCAHLKELDDVSSALDSISGKIASRLDNEGIIHLFGCGHSSLLAQDTYYRAGGLVPVRPLLVEPLMLHKGAHQSTINERTPEFVQPYLKKEDIRESDVLIVLSTSGRNPAPIDVALYGKSHGALVVSVQSLDYQDSLPSKHPSGKRLEAFADEVIDTKTPIGDAIEEREGMAEAFSPVSSVLGTALLHNLMTKVVDAMRENGTEPPLFKSGNVDGADDHNRRMIEKYKDRISF